MCTDSLPIKNYVIQIFILPSCQSFMKYASFSVFNQNVHLILHFFRPGFYVCIEHYIKHMYDTVLPVPATLFKVPIVTQPI